MCASLDGIAGQVLWDAGSQPTVADVITLLRTRFGNELQAERFKAELKVRRRRPNESLLQLYQDISKLVALAYPDSTQELSSHVAKEAYVIALNDPRLQLKVIEREPKTVEDALNIASKMEAFQASVIPPESNRGATAHKARPKVKATYAMESEEQVVPAKEDDQRSRGRALIEGQLADLQKQCNSNREALGRLKAQKDEAEKKAAQAAQAAKAAAQAAKTANPPASAGSAPNQDGGREITEAGAVVEATTKPGVTTSVASVDYRGTGLENVRMERPRNSQLRQRPKLWTTSQSVAGSGQNIGISPSVV